MIEGFCGETAQGGRGIGVTAGLFSEFGEFVGAELIGVGILGGGGRGGFFGCPKISAPRAFVAGTDAVAPIVTVGEAAAGEANDGRIDGAHVLDQLFADAIDVGDFGAFADPDAIVDYAAEVFGEVAVNVGGNGADRFVEDNFNAGIGGGGRGEERRCEIFGEESYSGGSGGVT